MMRRRLGVRLHARLHLRQRGLTIIELMVGVSLGALVSLLAVTLLVKSNAGFVAQAEAAAVDDAGRFALAALERAARQSAFIDWEREDMAAGSDPAAAPRVRGLDAASLSGTTEGIESARPAAVNGSDVLALRFAGSGPGQGDGSATTCAAFSVGAGEEGWSIFYVGLSAAGDAELRCKYRSAGNWKAEAVIGGIDSFQVLYGLDTDTKLDGMANQYVSATDINNFDAQLDLEGETETDRQRDALRKTWWKKVASIKVALVVHGAKQSRDFAGKHVFDLFGASYSAAAGARDTGARLDKEAMSPAMRHRERRTFAATILLRNTVR